MVQWVVEVEVEILVYMSLFLLHLYLHIDILLSGDKCILERNAILGFWLIYELDAPHGVHVVQVFCQIVSFLLFHHLERVVSVSFSRSLA